MTRPSTIWLIATAVLAAAAITPVRHNILSAHGLKFSAGEPGDAKKPSRTVEVRMVEEYGLQLFEPKQIVVKRGEQIRFVVRNTGEDDHEFMLATTKENLKHAAEMRKNPNMEHDEPNGITVKPGKHGEIVWRFTKRGTFEYACLIPGHREDGMFGKVIVK